jgi:UPF0755 protein
MSETLDVPRSRRSRHPRRRRRWGPIVLLLVLLLIFGAGVGGAVGYYAWCREAGAEHRPVTVRIPEGATGDDVVSILSERDVIRCGGIVGRSLLEGTGKGDEVRAGTYRLRTNSTLDQAIAVITKPPEPVSKQKVVSITIPEGYRMTQIADVADENLGVSASKVVNLGTSGDYALPPYLPKGKPTAEGFLFPNTYEFVKGDTRPGEVITELLDQFAVQAEELPWKRADRLGVSPYEIVVIASLIEREASVPEERPKIAAVIYNRLDAGEILGIDAALEYVDPTPADGLTESDLKIDSPYNTRLHKGLPPTPIASPGLASLQAALDPADVSYMYYVLCDEDGSHVFSTDYNDFLKDKARCLG